MTYAHDIHDVAIMVMGEAVSDKPQFRIRDLVGFTVALSVPLAMISSRTPLRIPGWVLLMGIALGGIGYLFDRRSL